MYRASPRLFGRQKGVKGGHLKLKHRLGGFLESDLHRRRHPNQFFPNFGRPKWRHFGTFGGNFGGFLASLLPLYFLNDFLKLRRWFLIKIQQVRRSKSSVFLRRVMQKWKNRLINSRTRLGEDLKASGPHFSTPNGSEIGSQIRKKWISRAIRISASKKEAFRQDLDPQPGWRRH